MCSEAKESAKHMQTLRPTIPWIWDCHRLGQQLKETEILQLAASV